MEIKSGKDYKRHFALCNVLADENYGIEYAYVFSEGNVEVSGKKSIFSDIYDNVSGKRKDG